MLRIGLNGTVLSLILLWCCLFTALCKGDEVSSNVHAELRHEKSLKLRVTLYSGTNKTVQVYRYQLPWGHRLSMVIIAVTANGRCLERELVIDDPLASKISLDPNTPISGEIDLESQFPELRRILRISDVQLFWAYQSPRELQIAQWSGGWILIPKEK